MLKDKKIKYKNKLTDKYKVYKKDYKIKNQKVRIKKWKKKTNCKF